MNTSESAKRMIKQSKKWYISFLFWSSLLLILWIHYLFIEPIRGEIANDTQSVQQAQNYYLNGQFQQAISLLENLLTTSEGIEQATIQCYLAASYRESGQLNKAIKNWKAALEIYQNQGDPAFQPQLIAVLIDLGQTYNALGQFRQAIPLLEEAIKLAENDQELKIQAIAWDILGTGHTLSGDYDKAIKAYETSLNLFDQLNHPGLMTITLNNLSNTFSKRQLKALDEARAAQLEEDETQANYLLSLAQQDQRSALATATQAVEVSSNLNSLSAVRARLQLMKLNSTLDYRTSVGSILEQLPNSRRKVYELINLAGLINESEAIGTLEKGIEIAHQLGDLRTASFALGTLGRVYEQKKQYDLALKFTHQSQLAAGQISAPDSLYRWQWQAGRIYRATGKREEAKVAYRQAIASLQSIRGDIAVANQNLQLDFRDEVEPVYRQLLEILLDGKTPSEIESAIQVFEGLQLSELQNFFGADCVEIIYAIKQPQVILAKTNTAVIHSIILKNQSYLILQLPNGTIKSYPINISQLQLQKKILRWRNELEDISSYRYLDLSKELYKLLIQPIENELELVQPNNLVFINDGLFRNIPIGALYDGQQFLLEKYPLSVTLGLNFITQSQSSGQWRSLTFGLTVAVPPFESLPNVAQETQEVQTILGGSRYLNNDFTFNNLQKQIRKKNYSVVHLATHGRFSGNADSAFLQAFDQQISLAELENLLDSSQKPIELLTLSACQTAAGNDRATLGLAGVAVRSGVKSTLGTLWFANDQATVELITDFYRYLEQGMTKSAALRQAQLNQIAIPGSHPSIWASFVLVGNWL